MNNALSSTHELARAALESRIAAGDIAHHSGRAEDFTRDTSRRLRELWGLPKFDCTTRHGFEVYRDSQGEFRALVDIPAGYWDHLIPQPAAVKFMQRAPAGAIKDSIS